MCQGLIVACLLVPLFSWDSVMLVEDVNGLPDMLPPPTLPDLAALPGLVIPAFSIAIIGLVQGASIGQTYQNPGGEYPDESGDFVGQGVASVAASLFQGMPVGGSGSATSLVVNGGARSHRANIFAGLVIAIVVILEDSDVLEPEATLEDSEGE